MIYALCINGIQFLIMVSVLLYFFAHNNAILRILLHIYYNMYGQNFCDYFHTKLSLPAATSKWHLTMPRSILP